MDTIAGHCARENAQGQDVSGRVLAYPFRDDAPVRHVGDRKKAGEISNDEKENLGEAKAHPGISNADSSTPRL
jgi:hypothetical protein